MASRPSASSSFQEEYYKVFQPLLDTVAHDPLDPAKRYHTGLFVETDSETGKGTMYHVTGDVLAASGMRYEENSEYEFQRLIQKNLVGFVSKIDYETRFLEILRGLPRPVRQQGINFWSNTREITWVRPDGELYGPQEERTPLMKCNEWTEQFAIPALRKEGLLIAPH